MVVCVQFNCKNGFQEQIIFMEKYSDKFLK